MRHSIQKADTQPFGPRVYFCEEDDKENYCGGLLVPCGGTTLPWGAAWG